MVNDGRVPDECSRCVVDRAACLTALSLRYLYLGTRVKIEYGSLIKSVSAIRRITR